MSRWRIAALGAIAAMALCTFAGVLAQQPPETLSNGLQRVQGAKVALAYVRPGTDWTKYKTILLQKLIVPASARNAAPPGTFAQFGESYLLNDDAVAKLQDMFAKSMHDTLSNAGFAVVTTPQPNTLVVAAEISKIYLNAPVESSRPDYAGMGMTLTRGGGSITIKAVLADGTSRVVLAELVDRKYGSNMWGVNNEVENLAEARDAFDQWAQELANKLKSP